MKSLFPLAAGVLCLAGCAGTTPAPAKSPRHAEIVSVIQPMEGLEIKPRIFTVPADKAARIDLPNGGHIAFPDHAFVDADGKPVSGTVTIEWQEFHSLADIMVSGIPMRYDSAGVSNQFVSGGMFTIDAHQGGKDIELAQGKEAEVALATYDAQRDFNFYSLNEQTGDWAYRETASATPNPEAAAETTASAQQTNKAENQRPTFLNVTASNTDSFPDLKGLDIVGWNTAGKLPKKTQREILKGTWNARITTGSKGTYTLSLTRGKGSRFDIPASPVTMDDALANTQHVEKTTSKRWEQLLAFQQQEKEAEMLRTASIPGFGTYNWDIIHRRESPIAFTLDLDIPGHENDAAAQIYHVCPEERAIVHYSEEEMENFSFDPTKGNCIIAVFPDKSVYAVSDKQFDEARSKKGIPEFTFNMKSRPERFTSGSRLGELVDKLI